MIIVILLQFINHRSNFVVHVESDCSTEERVLVIYVYAENHFFSLENLQYFINTAVRETDSADYIFILQQNDGVNINESSLPKIPKNARYIHHENACFDYGTIGWFFSEHAIGHPHKSNTLSSKTNQIDLRKYKYFIFMNSSIRGPYFPPFYVDVLSSFETKFRRKFYWYSIFTKRLSETVKLVGPLISCESSPHAQSSFLVTDFVGLSIALKSENKTGVFDCHDSFPNAITYSEIGFSKRILSEGYMIESLMRKYEKLNFTSPINQICNFKSNPHLNEGIDYISIDPYEMVFVKFNYKRDDWAAAERAKVYERWTRELNDNTIKYKQ